ncbi:MAG: oligopeptide/dipeptide ABC transporter ATP-binding protein, partial [Gemmobacter sp.]
VRHIATRVAVMYLGRIVEQAAASDLFAAPLHPYTRSLIAAAPRPEPGAARVRAPVEGDAPSALAPPPGCAFHPRCPLAVDRCRTERPELRGIGSSRVACHLAEAATGTGQPVRPVDPVLARRLAVLAKARETTAEGERTA